MSTDEEPTIVVFRKWRPSQGGGILALFPEVPSDNGGYYCLSYEHIGQHGGADYWGCIKQTRPAFADEYAPLFQELQDRGYNLVVREKASSAMHRRRRHASHQQVYQHWLDSDRRFAMGITPATPASGDVPMPVRQPVLKRLEFDDLVDE